jgi:hypothetical protein
MSLVPCVIPSEAEGSLAELGMTDETESHACQHQSNVLVNARLAVGNARPQAFFY